MVKSSKLTVCYFILVIMNMILLRQGCQDEATQPIMISTFYFSIVVYAMLVRWHKKSSFDSYSPLYDLLSTVPLFELLLLSTASSSFSFPLSTVLPSFNVV